MSTVKEEIAKNLLFYRKKCGFTQKELAQKLGVKNTAVSNWESGNNSIDIETLFSACEIFGITLNDMYGKYSVNKYSSAVSDEALKIAAAYDKATAKERMMVQVALSDYINRDFTPVRIAALSKDGQLIDFTGVDPEAAPELDFVDGPPIP